MCSTYKGHEGLDSISTTTTKTTTNRMAFHVCCQADFSTLSCCLPIQSRQSWVLICPRGPGHGCQGLPNTNCSCCVVLTRFPEEHGYSPHFFHRQPRYEAAQCSMALFPDTLPAQLLRDDPAPSGHCPHKSSGNTYRPTCPIHHS